MEISRKKNSFFADFLVLRLWSLIVFSGASFVLSDWTCWCSVLGKPLVSLVLRLWSLIVLSGASFVLSDWTCWCSILAKRLVSLVLRWSLVVLSGASFRLFDCGLSLDFLVVGVW